MTLTKNLKIDPKPKWQIIGVLTSPVRNVELFQGGEAITANILVYQWWLFFSCFFWSDQFLCKAASPRARQRFFGSAVVTVNDQTIRGHSSRLLENCLAAPQDKYWETCLFSNSARLSGRAGRCSAATFVHISCQQERQPFSEARTIFRKEKLFW